ITQLFDPFVQRGLRGSALLLLLAQLGQAILQLLDLQLERLAAAGDAGFGRHHLAGNILNTSGRLLTDTGEAFLGRHQALLHQADLLQAPPAPAGQGKTQRTDQCPQRPGAGAFGRRLAAGDTAAAYSRLLARLGEILAALRGQAGQVVELVVGVVTHGRTYGWNEENGNAAQYTDSPLCHQRRAKQVRDAPTKGATGPSTRPQPSSSAEV